MGRVIHFEIAAEDLDRAARFYERVMGWTAQAWGGPAEYLLVGTGASDEPGIDGAILRGNALHRGTVNTAAVEDLDAALGRVREAGGRVESERTAVRGVGYVAYCRDTEGNVFGLMQFDESAA